MNVWKPWIHEGKITFETKQRKSSDPLDDVYKAFQGELIKRVETNDNVLYDKDLTTKMLPTDWDYNTNSFEVYLEYSRPRRFKSERPIHGITYVKIEYSRAKEKEEIRYKIDVKFVYIVFLCLLIFPLIGSLWFQSYIPSIIMSLIIVFLMIITIKHKIHSIRGLITNAVVRD